MTVAADGVGTGDGHGTVLTPSLHTPCPAPPCILLLLDRIDLTGEACFDVTGHGLVILPHSGITRAVNWSGKMIM